MSPRIEGLPSASRPIWRSLARPPPRSRSRFPPIARARPVAHHRRRRASRPAALLAPIPLRTCGASLTRPPLEMRHDRESEVELRNDARAVINPLHELQHLDLGVADIPVLAPLLADSSQLTVVNSVMPDGMVLEERNPYRVADLAEGLINDLARRPLTHASEILAKDAAGRAAYLQHLTDWSRGHADMSPADLDLDVIETTTSGMELLVA